MKTTVNPELSLDTLLENPCSELSLTYLNKGPFCIAHDAGSSGFHTADTTSPAFAISQRLPEHGSIMMWFACAGSEAKTYTLRLLS